MEQLQQESTAQPGEGPNAQQPFNQQPNDELGAEVEIEDIEEDEYADEDFVSSPPRTASSSSPPPDPSVPDPSPNVSMSPDAAATRIQDVQRGRHVRKQLQQRTKKKHKREHEQEQGHVQSQELDDSATGDEPIDSSDSPLMIDAPAGNTNSIRSFLERGMRLSCIDVSNLLSFPSLKLDLTRAVSFVVGPGCCGKTNIIRIVQLFKGYFGARHLPDYSVGTQWTNC